MEHGSQFLLVAANGYSVMRAGAFHVALNQIIVLAGPRGWHICLIAWQKPCHRAGKSFVREWPGTLAWSQQLVQRAGFLVWTNNAVSREIRNESK